MTDLAVRGVTEHPAHDAVVTVMRGAVGAHVGILYRADDDGKRRHLHLADHYSLRDDESIADAFWVDPVLDELAVSDLGASARLIAKRYKDNRVPYAFNQKDAKVADDGILRLNQSLGLTCATFVLLVFDHAGISLIEVSTWEDRTVERKLEDDAAQARLVRHLQTRDPPHAQRVAQEIGCARCLAVSCRGVVRQQMLTMARSDGAPPIHGLAGHGSPATS